MFADVQNLTNYQDTLDYEDQGILKRLAIDALTSTPAQMLLGAIDKPGRIVRGILGGNFSEIGNIVPFSDSLGITDPSKNLSGRDLLRQYGAIGEEDNWGNFLGGMATEMLLDPLNYLTLGTKTSLTEIGKAAQKAGQTGLRDTAIGRLAAGQSGLLGVRTPWFYDLTAGAMGAPTASKAFLTGDAGINALSKPGQWAGKAREFVDQFSAGRAVTGAFDTTRSMFNSMFIPGHGITGDKLIEPHFGQVSKAAGEAAREELFPAMKAAIDPVQPVYDMLAERGVVGANADRVVNRSLARMVENIPEDVYKPVSIVDDELEQQVMRMLKPAVEPATEVFDNLKRLENAAGRPLQENSSPWDFQRYNPRNITTAAVSQGAAGKARTIPQEALFGGSVQADDLLLHPVAGARSKPIPEGMSRPQYLKSIAQQENELAKKLYDDAVALRGRMYPDQPTGVYEEFKVPAFGGTKTVVNDATGVTTEIDLGGFKGAFAPQQATVAMPPTTLSSIQVAAQPPATPPASTLSRIDKAAKATENAADAYLQAYKNVSSDQFDALFETAKGLKSLSVEELKAVAEKINYPFTGSREKMADELLRVALERRGSMARASMVLPGLEGPKKSIHNIDDFQEKLTGAAADKAVLLKQAEDAGVFGMKNKSVGEIQAAIAAAKPATKIGVDSPEFASIFMAENIIEPKTLRRIMELSPDMSDDAFETVMSTAQEAIATARPKDRSKALKALGSVGHDVRDEASVLDALNTKMMEARAKTVVQPKTRAEYGSGSVRSLSVGDAAEAMIPAKAGTQDILEQFVDEIRSADVGNPDVLRNIMRVAPELTDESYEALYKHVAGSGAGEGVLSRLAQARNPNIVGYTEAPASILESIGKKATGSDVTDISKLVDFLKKTTPDQFDTAKKSITASINEMTNEEVTQLAKALDIQYGGYEPGRRQLEGDILKLIDKNAPKIKGSKITPEPVSQPQPTPKADPVATPAPTRTIEPIQQVGVVEPRRTPILDSFTVARENGEKVQQAIVAMPKQEAKVSAEVMVKTYDPRLEDKNLLKSMKKLARAISSVGQDVVESRQFYRGDFYSGMVNRVESGIGFVERGQGTLEAIAKNVKTFDDIKAAPKDYISVREAVKNIGLSGKDAGEIPDIAKSIGLEGKQAVGDTVAASGKQTILKKLVDDGIVTLKDSNELYSGKAIDRELEKLYIPKSILKNLEIEYKGPGYTQLTGFAAKAKGYSDALRTWMTQPWMAFHTRNVGEGLLQSNMRTGINKQSYDDAMKYLAGAIDDPMKKAKLDERAVEAGLSGAAFRNQVAEHMGRSVVNDINSGIGAVKPTVTQEPGMTVMKAAKQWAKGYKPEVAALKGETYATLSPSKSVLTQQGIRASTAMDDVQRFAQYNYLRDQGMSVMAAKKAVTDTHLDYSSLTPFERDYVRTYIPFYSFSRKNLGRTMSQMENPGPLASLVRMGTGAGSESVVPGYVTQGAAVPVPGGEEGKQRYLSGLSMPYDDELLSAVVALGNLSPMEAGKRILGTINPLLRLPIALGTGRQLYTGRKFDEYNPSGVLSFMPNYAGNVTSEVLSATPLSRLISTVNTAASGKDVYTPLRLLTGVRTTEIDPQMANQLAIKDALARMIKRTGMVSTSETLYARKEYRGENQPDDLKNLLGLMQQMKQASQQMVKERTMP